ncbi:hypothetical protein TorRG33x02_327230 [Trema orientale]|uniref:Uncharacterized protein n=1 Tax=Trema orientale TaxID=63057 RepID=A0A2P5BB57_TREOI|nr:hypothetical protein TorRG33x02_327230 [Trema orientale]
MMIGKEDNGKIGFENGPPGEEKRKGEEEEERVSGSEEEGEAMVWVSTFLRPLPNIALRA